MTPSDTPAEQPDESTALLEAALGDSVDVLADIALMDVVEIAREAGRLIGGDQPPGDVQQA